MTTIANHTNAADTPYPCASHYPLSPEQVAQFQRDGFIKLKNVFTAEELAYWRPIFATAVAEQKEKLWYGDTPLAERDLYQKAFLQIMNLWVTNPETAPFCFE